MGLELREWTEQTSWDSFVASQECGHFGQSWAWGESQTRAGDRVHRLAVLRGGVMVAAMSVACSPIRHSRFGQLSVSRGPACDRPSREVFMALAGGLEDVARGTRSIVARVEPAVPAGDHHWTSLLRQCGFSPIHPPSQPRSTWILDLAPSLDELLGDMKPKWRYNIRLAERRGVEVAHGTESDVDEFYQVYQETARRDGFHIYDRGIYASTFRAFASAGQFKLMLARFEGRVIAAVTLIRLGKSVWYLYGASSSAHRDVMAPHLLQWEAIRWAKAQGATRYDFRGVPDVPEPGQEMYGVYRFKQGFGGRQLTYMETQAKGYRRPLASLWRAYWQTRHAALSAQRRMRGQPARQWA